MLFDSHAHLFSEALEGSLSDVLKRATQNGVSSILNVCTDPSQVEKALHLLKNSNPRIYLAGATHPHDAQTLSDSQFPVFERFAKEGKLKAIGETGLDYYYTHSTKEKQQQSLIRYLNLALECNLPVIIHCRDAFSDLFDILGGHYPQGKGVFHCFTGSEQEAEEALSRGFYLSFSGVVTFKKSFELREVLKKTPLDKILVETDAPYLAPQSRRGKTNEPAFIVETATCIANVKGISFEEVAKHTTANCKALFSI